jgi:hypothetical protein
MMNLHITVEVDEALVTEVIGLVLGPGTPKPTSSVMEGRIFERIKHTILAAVPTVQSVTLFDPKDC